MDDLDMTKFVFERCSECRMPHDVCLCGESASESRESDECNLTKRALDAGESARFSGVFWLWVFPVSTGNLPSHPPQVTQAVLIVDGDTYMDKILAQEEFDIFPEEELLHKFRELVQNGLSNKFSFL